MSLTRNKLKTITRYHLRSIIRETIVEATNLNKRLYGTLEKAIADSKFWIEGNTEDDGDYEDVPGLDLIHQTSAAQYLQDVLQATVDNAGEDIIIAVQSPELDANPGFLLTPDKPQYPDSVISGGYATITPDGKQAVVLNMSLFDDSFSDDDVNPRRIARKGAGILRHEMIHLQQVAARAKSEDISLIDAFENFRKEPKSIPPEGAGRQQYIKSHIEIDAHAHQAADELLALYGKEEALRLISKTVDFEDLGVDLPHAIEDYLIDNPSGKTARQFRKKVYEYINSINQKLSEANDLESETALRQLIREELESAILNEFLEKGCTMLPRESMQFLACNAVLWINARIPHTEWFTIVAIGKRLPNAVRLLGLSKGTAAAASVLGGLAAAGIFVFGMFTALPEMIQRRIEFLDTVKGYFMNMQDMRKRTFQTNKHSKYAGPLEYDHLSATRSEWIPQFGNVSRDRDGAIDLIASQMGTPEGQKLYNKLISNDVWAIPGIFGLELMGAKWRGPIIGKSISSRILKRRKEIIDEANEKMRIDLSKRLKELYAEGDYEEIVEFAQTFGWDPAKPLDEVFTRSVIR
jgi:hypothetical protein